MGTDADEKSSAKEEAGAQVRLQRTAGAAGANSLEGQPCRVRNRRQRCRCRRGSRRPWRPRQPRRRSWTRQGKRRQRLRSDWRKGDGVGEEKQRGAQGIAGQPQPQRRPSQEDGPRWVRWLGVPQISPPFVVSKNLLRLRMGRGPKVPSVSWSLACRRSRALGRGPSRRRGLRTEDTGSGCHWQ